MPFGCRYVPSGVGIHKAHFLRACVSAGDVNLDGFYTGSGKVYEVQMGFTIEINIKECSPIYK